MAAFGTGENAMATSERIAKRNAEIQAMAAGTAMTQRELAEHFGVSAATVNVALKWDPTKPKQRTSKPRRKGGQRQPPPPIDPEADPPDLDHTLRRVLARQEQEAAAAYADENPALARQLDRDIVATTKELSRHLPTKTERQGAFVSTAEEREAAMAVLEKLRDYAARAREELAADIRKHGVVEALVKAGILPAAGPQPDIEAVSGEELDGDTPEAKAAQVPKEWL
jgi:hypothetical protein